MDQRQRIVVRGVEFLTKHGVRAKLGADVSDRMLRYWSEDVDQVSTCPECGEERRRLVRVKLDGSWWYPAEQVESWLRHADHNREGRPRAGLTLIAA